MIIRRYFHHEVWRTFLAILAILILIYMGHRFVRFLNAASAGDLSEQAIFSLLLLKTLSSQVILIPLSAFLATLITLGRMHQDNEITALLSTGSSPQSLLRHIALFSLILAAIVGLISWQFAPQAEEQSYKIQDQMRADVHSRNISPAQFNSFDYGRSIVYAESATNKGQTLHQVFIQRETSDGRIDIAFSESAQKETDPNTGEEYFILKNGTRYALKLDSKAGQRIAFKENGILLQPLEIKEKQRKRWALPTQQLMDTGDIRDIAEVQWRVAAIISTFLLPLLAFFLSKSEGRSGKYAKLMTGILIYLLYNNLLAASKAWVENGELIPIVGLWWVHVIIVGFIIFLARKQGLFYKSTVLPQKSQTQ